MELPGPIKAFLQKPLFAVLATISPSGRPQATPVWYLHESDHILINTSEGRKKLQNLKANPRVALTIVDPDDPYRYVQIQGKVVKFDREHGARDIDRLSMRYRGKAHRYLPADGPEKRVSILIQPVRFNTNGIK
ncbi:MAG TPA: PPOX class F420-dependent oxidoreductase [bacterium]|nr:PPOX class F420-dependent oxidoreductase [bacterium]